MAMRGIILPYDTLSKTRLTINSSRKELTLGDEPGDPRGLSRRSSIDARSLLLIGTLVMRRHEGQIRGLLIVVLQVHRVRERPQLL